ncbi:MAG: LrgB family protein, partial [Zoogloeaceae bacterium]|nr:LrgB family protein [Zoogloeaceae bacterium]
LFGLAATLLAYCLGDLLYRRCRYTPLLNPVFIAIVALIGFLMLLGVSYEDYFTGAQFIHFLLGPATVALAIPLYNQFRTMRALLLPLLVSLCAGSLTAIVSGLGLAKLLGLSKASLISLAPKAATTPIAIGIVEHIGGVPALAVGMVIIAGIGGAIGYPFLCRLIRVDDPIAQGFAVGLASHGVGTARALQVDPQSGAFAALAMSLNGCLTAVLAPLFVHWLV